MFPLITVDDACSFIGVSRKIFVYYAFRTNLDLHYKEFSIARRSGGYRHIQSPTKKLQLLQRSIAKALTTAYSPRVVANGFIKERSIVDNAAPHVGARWIINVDIEDFFRSINFGRVRGLFMGHPFRASAAVATGLARICCYRGALAVGAPSSPVISNLVCRNLDRSLLALSRSLNLKVTRYADDITLSSKKTTIPEALAQLNSAGTYEPGTSLVDIIGANGFTIHPSKFKVRTRANRQEVTGLVVNRFVNVKRSYIRNIWQTIHAWRKFGIEKAAEHHFTRYRSEGIPPDEDAFRRTVAGRVAFVRSVRGEEDPIYLKMARALREICPKIELPTERDIVNHYEKVVWVHDAVGDAAGEEEPFQGTVFHLDDLGICGAYHCVGLKENEVYPPSSKLQYKVSTVSYDAKEDWVILKLDEDYIGPSFSSLKAAKYKPHVGQRIRVLGYPKWGKGASITVQSGQIIGINTFDGVERYKVDCTIVTGNSGGPVVDEQDRVIGIAVKGNESFSSESATGENLVIPISLLHK